MLKSVGHKVHNSVAEGSVKAQISKFSGQLGGDDGVKCRAEVNRQHLCICEQIEKLISPHGVMLQSVSQST